MLKHLFQHTLQVKLPTIIRINIRQNMSDMLIVKSTQ